MLVGEGRRRWRARGTAAAHRHAHDHDEAHEHEHPASDHATRAHDHGHATHDHGHDADHGDDCDHARRAQPRRRHATATCRRPGTTISWRSLFVLGLAGGLIPSTSALLILLGSIAAGRPAFGFVLVVAFGLGMALVMGGIGLALVLARGRLDRVDSSSPLGRASGYVPLVASVLVFGLGIYLTVQALAGNTTL